MKPKPGFYTSVLGTVTIATQILTMKEAEHATGERRRVSSREFVAKVNREREWNSWAVTDRSGSSS